MGRSDYDDERTVIVERESNNGVGMMLLGLAIGAGAALLFAPASGEETRERLQREARRAGRKVKDMTDAVSEGVSDRVDRTRSSFEAQVDRARSAVGSRVSAVGNAVEGGREAADDAREHLAQAVADAKRAYAESRRAYRDARLNHRLRDTYHHTIAPLVDGDSEPTSETQHDGAHGSAKTE